MKSGSFEKAVRQELVYAGSQLEKKPVKTLVTIHHMPSVPRISVNSIPSSTVSGFGR